MMLPKRQKRLINQFELETEYKYIDTPNWVKQIEMELMNMNYTRGNE